MALLDDPETLALVKRASGGDHDAWSALVRQVESRLYRVAQLRLDRRLAARLGPEDLVQDVLVDVLRSLESFLDERNPLSFSAWIRQRLVDLIHRVHRDHLLTQKRNAGRERAVWPGPSEPQPYWLTAFIDSASSPSHCLTRDEAQRVVAEGIRNLSEIDREILGLFFFEGYSHADIGLILDLKPDAVTARQHRAVKHLGSLLRRNHADWCHDAFPRAHRIA